MKVLVLGCGTSTGVPLIGCKCPVCSSSNPNNKRLRPSIMVSENNFNILIDTSPDLRTQALKYGITQIDLVLYTHTHADHLFGIDDLRMFNYVKANYSPIYEADKNKNAYIPIYGSEKTIKFIEDKFDYIFKEKTSSSKPYLLPHEIKIPIKTNGIDIAPIPVYHGENLINGYRINDFAYITDVSKIPESSFELLKNLKVLMIDALRFRTHKTHFSVEEAIAVSNKIAPKMTYFTHMGHDIDYDEMEKIAVSKGNFMPSRDGLTIEI